MLLVGISKEPDSSTIPSNAQVILLTEAAPTASILSNTSPDVKVSSSASLGTLINNFLLEEKKCYIIY